MKKFQKYIFYVIIIFLIQNIYPMRKPHGRVKPNSSDILNWSGKLQKPISVPPKRQAEKPRVTPVYNPRTECVGIIYAQMNLKEFDQLKESLLFVSPAFLSQNGNNIEVTFDGYIAQIDKIESDNITINPIMNKPIYFELHVTQKNGLIKKRILCFYCSEPQEIISETYITKNEREKMCLVIENSKLDVEKEKNLKQKIQQYEFNKILLQDLFARPKLSRILFEVSPTISKTDNIKNPIDQSVQLQSRIQYKVIILGGITTIIAVIGWYLYKKYIKSKKVFMKDSHSILNEHIFIDTNTAELISKQDKDFFEHNNAIIKTIVMLNNKELISFLKKFNEKNAL